MTQLPSRMGQGDFPEAIVCNIGALNIIGSYAALDSPL